MLTKDLIRHRVIAEQIKPKFIRTDDPKLLSLAEGLLALYQPGRLRGEIQEDADAMVRTIRDLKLAKGLNKIILDQSDFPALTEEDYQTRRAEVFRRGAEILKSGALDDSIDSYTETLKNSLSDELKDFVTKGIYADLPENEKLGAPLSLSPSELLNRYNTSLVQSLLLYTAKLELVIEDPEPAKMRRLLRYLKFFRLLADIKNDAASEPETENSKKKKKSPQLRRIKMDIDGPASIFENTQKYGLQLASFFPAVTDMQKWYIEADITLKSQALKLKLDHKTKLRGHYGNYGAYIPEEITMFEELFRRKVSDWEINSELPFITLPGGEMIFPDMSFRKAESFFGEVVNLELFHRWHSTHLFKRLEICAKNPSIPLIIGVDKYLASKPEIKERLDSSEFFARKGFAFNNFPGVERVKKMLDGFFA